MHSACTIFHEVNQGRLDREVRSFCIKKASKSLSQNTSNNARTNNSDALSSSKVVDARSQNAPNLTPNNVILSEDGAKIAIIFVNKQNITNFAAELSFLHCDGVRIKTAPVLAFNLIPSITR